MKELNQIKANRTLDTILKNLHIKEYIGTTMYVIRENNDIAFIDISHRQNEIRINLTFLEHRYGIVYDKLIHNSFLNFMKDYSGYAFHNLRNGKRIYSDNDKLLLI